ncbi:hypothetical protein BHE74_00023480 [Ensete ventricosum]|nr:hypothetical protein BHE74_00023480 [Ensete ventricosum]
MGGTYRFDKRWDEVLPRYYAGRRGSTSSSCAVTEPCSLVGRRGARLPSLGRGTASFFYWKARWVRGGASSSCAVTRWRLILPLEDEMSSFVRTRRCLILRWKARRYLIFQRWDEALPRSSWAGTRGYLIFFVF